MSTDDLSYELGSGTVLPELDTELQGARAGDIFKFNAELPDGPVTFQVLVKEVKQKVLPDVTDEWASEASEFDTVEELRNDLVERIGGVKRLQAAMALRNQVVEAVVELVTEDAPEPLVDAELERRAHDLAHRLEAQSATIAQYLEAIGQTEEQLVVELRQGATSAVKADLALRAVADAEQIEVSDDELAEELARMAERLGQKPAQVLRQLERAEQMPAVRSDIRKGKALEWLTEHVEIVDPEGHPIDRALLEPKKPDAEASGEDQLEDAVETEEE
jgi:trigger factor